MHTLRPGAARFAGLLDSSKQKSAFSDNGLRKPSDAPGQPETMQIIDIRPVGST